jgi:hypothetical protein
MATGRCVAHYRHRNVLKGRKGQLTIEPEAERTMDIIIIAFIILQDKKDSDGSKSNSAFLGANAIAAVVS